MHSTTRRELWLSTGDAVRHLGISADTLKRYKDPNYPHFCLQEGIHWQRGLAPNSPIRWAVDQIEAVVRERSTTAPRQPAAAVLSVMLSEAPGQ
ncbi:MAG: hypothetical protein NTV57_17165 [Cyanobacteria bacterium]|nr:hypothetical protein [Cyanobacteriota bacterium]